LAFLAHGAAVLAVLGLAFSTSVIISACHLNIRMYRRLARSEERLRPSVIRVAAGAAVMAAPAWFTATSLRAWIGGGLGPRVAILAAALVGCVVFVSVQVLVRSREVAWVTGGLRFRGGTHDGRWGER
jgi:putative peptidoglycan lipid II flippase